MVHGRYGYGSEIVLICKHLQSACALHNTRTAATTSASTVAADLASSGQQGTSANNIYAHEPLSVRSAAFSPCLLFVALSLGRLAQALLAQRRGLRAHPTSAWGRSASAPWPRPPHSTCCEALMRPSTGDPAVTSDHASTAAGWRNFWRGNMLNCVRTAPFKAVNYTAFDYLNRAICGWRGGNSGGYERFLAGAGAGMVATITCMPLDIVRTRMMSPRHHKSIFKTIVDMFAQEGLGAFYTGCLPALASMAVGGATFYGTCAAPTLPPFPPAPSSTSDPRMLLWVYRMKHQHGPLNQGGHKQVQRAFCNQQNAFPSIHQRTRAVDGPTPDCQHRNAQPPDPTGVCSGSTPK